METKQNLVAHAISAERIPYGYWIPILRTLDAVGVSCQHLVSLAPNPPRQYRRRGWRQRVVRPGYGGGSRNGVKPSSGVPR